MPRGRPKVGEVAAAANVSTAAVSYALNGRPGVSAATRRRILDVADRLGWQPSASGRALATAQSFAVGLVISRPAELLAADPFFASFIAGMEVVLGPRDYSLLLRITDSSDEAIWAAYERLGQTGAVDGFVLCDLCVADTRPALVERLGIPAILVGAVTAGLEHHPHVSVNEEQGVAAAVEHLAELGHRAIAHVAGPQRYVHTAARRDAWRAACRRVRLAPGPVVASDFTPQGGADATKALLDGGRDVTAVLFANDLTAYGGIAYLSARGIRVPDDISVVGFDDNPLSGSHHPPLTTVHTDPVGWGAAAASDLLTLIQGQPVESHVLDSCDLLIRATTARPPAAAATVDAGGTAPAREEQP